MTRLWRRRQFQSAAYAWKRECESELVARIKIAEAILSADRQELAELRLLEGEQLARRYGCYSPAEVDQTMALQREFIENLGWVWAIEGRWQKSGNRPLEDWAKPAGIRKSAAVQGLNETYF